MRNDLRALIAQTIRGNPIPLSVALQRRCLATSPPAAALHISKVAAGIRFAPSPGISERYAP
jgi:hypothetical protein